MDWDTSGIVWPTIDILLTVAAVFFIWALKRRKKNPGNGRWKQTMVVAVFCLLASLMLAFINSIGNLPLIARMGIVSVILCSYVVYNHQYNKKKQK